MSMTILEGMTAALAYHERQIQLLRQEDIQHTQLRLVDHHSRAACLREWIGRLTPMFLLTESDACAVTRVLYRSPVSSEGTSGPKVRELLTSLRKQVGPARYEEWVGKDWPCDLP